MERLGIPETSRTADPKGSTIATATYGFDRWGLSVLHDGIGYPSHTFLLNVCLFYFPISHLLLKQSR